MLDFRVRVPVASTHRRVTAILATATSAMVIWQTAVRGPEKMATEMFLLSNSATVMVRWGAPEAGGGGCFFDENSGVDVCKCGKIGTWGELGSSSTGLVGGVDSLSAWLNLSSTLKADYTQAKPEITQEYLWQYDVLILQNLESWAPFTGPELEVFEAWLKSGGGLIALGGYAHDSQALAVANDLLFLTKMSFQSLSDTFASSPAECGHCYGNSVPQEGFLEHPIALYVTRIGAFHGHEVEPGDAVVVAEDPMEGVLGAAKDVGAGRAFLFHDEWVTYQEEWSGESIPAADSCRNDSQSACYGKGPGRDYQPAQFWYNALKWVLHERPCFALDDPSVVK